MSAPMSRAAASSIGSSTVCGQFAIGSGLAARYSAARSALVPQVSDRATSRPASVVTHRLLAIRCCGVATAWNLSLIPRCRRISTVRWLMMCARGVWAVPLCRSTRRCPTPYRDNAADRASPAGPAPTISTGTSIADGPVIDMGRLRLGAPPPGWCRTPACQSIRQESTEQQFIDIIARNRYSGKMSYAVAVATTPPTRTEQVYEILRGELLNGGLHPGQKLKMVELTERFAVSQSVVREALTRLTEQDLLVATPQRGFRVRDLSVEDIAELTETRIEVESLALRLAVG